MKRTLSVQEVADGHRVGAVGNVWGLEHLLDVRLGLQAHVLLAERSDLLLDVGVLLSQLLECHLSPVVRTSTVLAMTYKLLRQRHLLKRHAVHTCGGAANRGREDHRRLHDGERSKRVDEEKKDIDGGRVLRSGEEKVCLGSEMELWGGSTELGDGWDSCDTALRPAHPATQTMTRAPVVLVPSSTCPFRLSKLLGCGRIQVPRT